MRSYYFCLSSAVPLGQITTLFVDANCILWTDKEKNNSCFLSTYVKQEIFSVETLIYMENFVPFGTLPDIWNFSDIFHYLVQNRKKETIQNKLSICSFHWLERLSKFEDISDNVGSGRGVCAVHFSHRIVLMFLLTFDCEHQRSSSHA